MVEKTGRVIGLSASGPLHPVKGSGEKAMNVIEECMTQLFSLHWEGKTVWEKIKDDEFTSAPAFKGRLYDDMPIKIMYVGHAVNGWDFDASKCLSIEETVDSVLSQDGVSALDTFVNAKGYPYMKKNGKPGVYYHYNSKFIRLIKQVLEYQGHSETPTTMDTWYNDAKEWNQKFVWSNLYNIAPKNGGNPEPKFIKLGMPYYTEIIKSQIEMYKPDIVIFLPLSGYFVPWVRERSFDEILDSYEQCSDDSPIIGKGSIGQTQVIVCKRPDVPGTSYEEVNKMAKSISDYIDGVCKKS